MQGALIGNMQWALIRNMQREIIGYMYVCVCTIERQESALNMSKKTKQVKVIVVSLGVIILSSI